METIKQVLSKWGIHTFLLPVFFVLHNYIQYFGLVNTAVALKTLLQIWAVISLVFLGLFFFTRNVNASFQLTSLFSFSFLFYGVIKDSFANAGGLSFLGSYSVLLPLMTVVLLLLCLIILRKKNFSRINLFQNLLLICFILFDTVLLLFTRDEIFRNRNLMVQNRTRDIASVAVPALRPDVYYLLFDCYPGTDFLKEYMEFDNRPMDSALREKGFRVIGSPRSNYNRTAFSMASALNFQYLNNINNTTAIAARHYSKARLAIKEAAVPKLFEHMGYKQYNLSIFEFNGQKPIYREDFLTLPEQRVLLYNTLAERFKEDVLWNFVSGRYSIGFLKKIYTTSQKEITAEQLKKRNFNETIADSVQAIAGQNEKLPKFVYAHFYLPHPPFFYTENGKPNNLDFVITEKSLLDKQLFISYLKYTNSVMLKIVDSIQSGSRVPPVIVIQSDHGFRDFLGGPKVPHVFFKNYTAFYFPDHDYSMLYDTLSNVNTFPLIFNKYFRTRIPLQRDTSIFLPY